MPTVTQATYLRELILRLFPDAALHYGTASGTGSTTTVVYASGATSFTQTSSLVGQWIRTTTGSTTEYSRIASVAASGTMTVDKAITSTTSSTTFEITGSRHPAQLERMIDRVLVNTYTPALFPLTTFFAQDNSVDDNDMEVSTATAWSGTATPSKSSFVPHFPHGTQQLIVAGTAGQLVTQDSTWYVTSGHQYHASIHCASKLGDQAEFQIYDVSNSAEIEDAATHQTEWVELSFDFTPPSGCEEIDARLVCVDDGQTYWKDISVVNTDQRIFRTPYWLTKEAQMIDILEIPRGPAGPSGDNEYRTFESPLRGVPWKSAYNQVRSTNELALQVEPYSQNLRYIYAKKPGVALTANTSTGYVDVDIVVENCLKLIEAQDSEGGRLATWRILANLRESSLAAGVEQPTQHSMAYFA